MIQMTAAPTVIPVEPKPATEPTPAPKPARPERTAEPLPAAPRRTCSPIEPNRPLHAPDSEPEPAERPMRRGCQ